MRFSLQRREYELYSDQNGLLQVFGDSYNGRHQAIMWHPYTRDFLKLAWEGDITDEDMERLTIADADEATVKRVAISYVAEDWRAAKEYGNERKRETRGESKPKRKGKSIRY